MSSNYVNNHDDPIVEIFNTEQPENNDAQIINRVIQDPFDNNYENKYENKYDNKFDNKFDSNLITTISTPTLSHEQLYGGYENGQQFNNIPGLGAGILLRKDEESIFAMAPHSSNEYETENVNNQLTTISLAKYVAPLPPLPPLSESVIPHGLNIQPLALQGGAEGEIVMEKKPVTTKKKKESAGPKAKPAFVMKIWSMVNDITNKDYICWNEDGKTFQVFHREEFMKLILPKYFKHNNFASFVRQLNMYGWHKVQDINSGTLNISRDDKNSEEVWQFENPYFIKDREDLLDKIVRNKSVNQDNDSNETNQINFSLIMNELDQIKMNQLAISEDLRRVRKDNKTLWQENYITRERHQQQAQTLDKILKFLAAVYGSNAGKFLEVENTSVDELGNQMTTYNFQQGQQQTSNPYAQQQPSPFHKPRLMLTNQAHKISSVPSSSKTSNQSMNKDINKGSIEEIIRSYENTPNSNYSGDNGPGNNANKMYQQIINQDPVISSPRHLFPELNSNSPYIAPSTPGSQYFRLNTIEPSYESNQNDLMIGLEQNIYKQGQSIQQVQDWIQKLATQQQQQQQQLQQQQANRQWWP